MAGRTRDTTSGIYAVAAEAWVIVMTVSRAMRGVEGVSTARREAILQIARRLNYVPNSNARALSQANADLIGISVPNLLNDVFADVLQGTRGTIQKAGYFTVIDMTDYNMEVELRWVSRLLSVRPAALILTGIGHYPDSRSTLRAAGVPTLDTWDFSLDPIDVCVDLDHVPAGADLARYVHELGYRSPAFVGARVGMDPRADARLRGLETVFRAPVVRTGAAPENAFRMGAERARLAEGSPPRRRVLSQRSDGFWGLDRRAGTWPARARGHGRRGVQCPGPQHGAAGTADDGVYTAAPDGCNRCAHPSGKVARRRGRARDRAAYQGPARRDHARTAETVASGGLIWPYGIVNTGWNRHATHANDERRGQGRRSVRDDGQPRFQERCFRR
nr:LacI family DNA-binding transcriptional regulator [Jannaschia faecimaris]